MDDLSQRQGGGMAGSGVQALTALCSPYFKDLSWIGSCRFLPPEELPQLARELLDHQEHMTPTLRAHYAGELVLRPIAWHENGNSYGREILLISKTSTGERIVEAGVMRMELQSVSEAVREEIRSRSVPLGDILQRAGALTQVRPLWFLAFPRETPVAKLFGRGAAEVYGRLATIDVNGSRAVELLEAIRV